MKGTWQGSGTWQTSGPDLGALVRIAGPVAIAAVVITFIAHILLWLAVAAACLLIATVVAVVLIWRHTRRREAEVAAALAARRERPGLTATATPQVTAPSVQVVEHRHYIIPVTAPDPASAIVRAAITGTPGVALTEEVSHVPARHDR